MTIFTLIGLAVIGFGIAALTYEAIDVVVKVLAR